MPARLFISSGPVRPFHPRASRLTREQLTQHALHGGRIAEDLDVGLRERACDGSRRRNMRVLLSRNPRDVDTQLARDLLVLALVLELLDVNVDLGAVDSDLLFVDLHGDPGISCQVYLDFASSYRIRHERFSRDTANCVVTTIVHGQHHT